MKNTLRVFVALIVVLGPHTISIATSPTLPYHHYNINGKIMRTSGGSKKDFTVALFSKSRFDPTSAYRRIYGQGAEFERAISITDSAGTFSLSVRDYAAVDSIAVGIVLPDRQTLLGESLSRMQLISTTMYGTFTNNDVKGCNGCSSPTTSTIVVGYRYQVPEQTIQIPF